MPKLDLVAIPFKSGCNYPVPFDKPCLGSTWQKLALAGGLTAFGVNLSRIPPGVWSSQRHWHTHEDEFIYLLEGELVLVTDAGEQVMGAGDCAAFKMGDTDGHHFINRSDSDAVVLEVGNADPVNDRCTYNDIDMIAEPGVEAYLHRDGAAYPINSSDES